MKLITAIIQPAMLDDVQKSLIRHGVSGMTVSEVSGYARQRGHSEVYRGERLSVDFILKVRLEILAQDEDVAGITDALVESARTGVVGDGKVWVTPIDNVIRVRTGESGDFAI
jgi:nitrogen regulatory protein P-II 1